MLSSRNDLYHTSEPVPAAHVLCKYLYFAMCCCGADTQCCQLSMLELSDLPSVAKLTACIELEGGGRGCGEDKYTEGRGVIEKMLQRKKEKRVSI